MAERPSGVTIVETPPHMDELSRQVHTFFNRFHDRVLGGKSKESTEKDTRAEKALVIAITTIQKNNRISNTIRSPRFEIEVKAAEQEVVGETGEGKIICTDGRLERPQFSHTANTVEVLGGRIALRRRASDDLLIPKSSMINEVLRDPKAIRHGLLEDAYAHYDSQVPTKGCAANKAFLAELQELIDDPKAKSDIFTKEEAERILKLKPEDANVEIIKKTTAAAIDNFHNSAREAAGRGPLARVTIVGLIDTAYMGIEFRNGSDTLSSTDLVNRYKQKLSDIGVAEFGDFRETFCDDDQYFAYQKAKVDIVRAIVDDRLHGFSSLKQEIAGYASRNYSDLTDGQSRRFRTTIKHQIAHQFLTGLSDYDPNHPFSSHSEQVLAVSEDGLLPGKYNPEQIFGTNAADPKDGAKQIGVELKVLDDHDLATDCPRVLFVCGSANEEDIRTNNMRRIRKTNHQIADFMVTIISNPDLRRRIKNGDLIPLPAIVDERTRKVLAIPDLTPYL